MRRPDLYHRSSFKHGDLFTMSLSAFEVEGALPCNLLAQAHSRPEILCLSFPRTASATVWPKAVLLLIPIVLWRHACGLPCCCAAEGFTRKGGNKVDSSCIVLPIALQAVCKAPFKDHAEFVLGLEETSGRSLHAHIDMHACMRISARVWVCAYRQTCTHTR